MTPRAVSGENNVALFLRRMGRVLLVLGAVLDCTPLIVPREQILSSTCSSPGRGAATRCSAGNLASSRVAGSKIRSAWRSPGSASALRSKNMNGAGGPMCIDHGLSSLKRMSQRFAGSSTLRGKNVDGAGGLMCVGHGLRSSGSTSWSFADSSALKGQVVDGKAWNCRQSSDFDDLFVPCTSPSQRVHLVDSVVRLSSSQDTHDMHGDMNSCGSVHGGGVHDNSSGLHVNSCGALGHKNSCHVHAAEVRGGTKALWEIGVSVGRGVCAPGETKSLSTSTRLGVRCLAVEKLASPQQAPGSLHGEVWASLLQNQGPKIFREVEIVPGCAVTVACPSCPDHSPEPPGPGRIIRNMLGWSLEEKNVMGSGVWLFRGALQGKNLFSSFDVSVDWVRNRSYHTAWAVPCDFLCTCSYSYGQGPAIGPHTGHRRWPLLKGVWRAIAPLMKPWCAEGEVPTAANLNLYRGGNSCVGWHRDDELLVGEFGEAKLIVSVSLGGSAVFRWKRRSCPDDEGHLCCLGHGDILVMDGRCQDEFLHRTDPGREQERINITFCWIKQHVSSCPLFRTGVACCLPTCAQGLSVPDTGNFGHVSLQCLVCLGSASFAGLPFAHKTWVSLVCLLLDTSFWRCSVGALPLESLEGMSGSS